MNNVMSRVARERDEAERKAIDSLGRYKFQMFGYWAAVWVHLNHLCEDRQPNPFQPVVHAARDIRAADAAEQQEQP